MILVEAKSDGCIWIPYEVTEEENRIKREQEKEREKEESRLDVANKKTPGNSSIGRDEPINVQDLDKKSGPNVKRLLNDLV